MFYSDMLIIKRPEE